MDVDAVAADLYRTDPSEFVAARSEQVKRAREAGDRDAAKEIAALKKPTVVGWAVNLLSGERPEEVDSVLALGDALQRAQRRLDAETLRDLTAQRHRVVRALAKRAQTLARERGRELNETAVREVSQTLHAAMADPELARTVRNGRVRAAASYSGFGPAGLESVDVGAAADDGATRATAPDARSRRRDRRAREREEALERARVELRSAQEQAREAHDALTASEREHDDARAAASEAADRVRDLRRELAHLEERAEFLARAETAAGDAVAAARDAAERADQRVAEAEAVVADLR